MKWARRKLCEIHTIVFKTNCITKSNVFYILLGTVWTFGNFSATLILLEINFGWFQKVKNCHFINFGSFEFWFLENFHTSKVKSSKIQNSEPMKWSKWQFFGLLSDQNRFHIKIWEAEKSLNYHTVTTDESELVKKEKFKYHNLTKNRLDFNLGLLRFGNLYHSWRNKFHQSLMPKICLCHVSNYVETHQG